MILVVAVEPLLGVVIGYMNNEELLYQLVLATDDHSFLVACGLAMELNCEVPLTNKVCQFKTSSFALTGRFSALYSGGRGLSCISGIGFRAHAGNHNYSFTIVGLFNRHRSCYDQI